MNTGVAKWQDNPVTAMYVNCQPPLQWVTGHLYPKVKRPEREADHLPPSDADVKNAWSCTSTPRCDFVAW